MPEEPTTVSIYNMPPDLREKLEEEAKKYRRSLSQHVIFILEQKSMEK